MSGKHHFGNVKAHARPCKTIGNPGGFTSVSSNQETDPNLKRKIEIDTTTYIYSTHMLHVWNIDQHLPYESPSFVGK